MNRKEEQHQSQSVERLTSRRLVGAPPSAAAMRIAAKTSKSNERKRKHSAIEAPTEEDESDEETVEKASQDVQDEEESKQQAEEETIGTPTEKKRRRKKRRIRLTDQGLKAKRKAERREKLLAEKREREDYQTADEDDEVDFKQAETNGENEMEEKQKAPQQKVRPPPETLTPFQLFCDNILRKLVQKDPEGYFTHPVSEVDAPDYKEVIEHPMDFSTIRDKIEQNLYENIGEFQADVELITNNAQLYNSPGSLFFIAAQKLGVLTRYYFSEKYLTYLVYSLPFGRTVPLDRIGIHTVQRQTKERSRHEINIGREREKMRSFIKDNSNPKELIEASPKEIKKRLAMRKPNCHIAYLDNQDGAIALNVLTTAICEESRFKLGDWVKPLEKGTPGICTPFEPLIGQDYLISYTNPGPYASFAPQYDSTWATLSKRESDLLLSCYGDKDNVADAFALRQMVANAGEAASSFVEDMLNEITDGEHARTIAELEGKSVEKSAPNNPIDEKLQRTGQKLQELAKIQDKRLSRPPPPTLSHTAPPDMQETQLAGEIVRDLGSQIVEMEVRPCDVVSTQAVHQALGLDAADLEILSEFLEV